MHTVNENGTYCVITNADPATEYCFSLKLALELEQRDARNAAPIWEPQPFLDHHENVSTPFKSSALATETASRTCVSLSEHQVTSDLWTGSP